MKIPTLLLAAACVLFVAANLNADEPVPPPPVQADVPQTLPSPPPPPPRATGQSEHGLSQVEHLRRAAQHLEAAGAEELAREIREEADALLEASFEQISQKREQLARLQREIAQLERLTGLEQQVMLRCRVVDVDISKVRRLGFSWSSMTDDNVVETCSGGALPFRFGPNDAGMMDGIIDALVREDLARVLAEPVLITTNGRPANLHSGGEFPVLLPDGPDDSKIEFREFGLRLEAVPVVLGDGRVRLDIAPELATRDFGSAVTVNGHVVPGLNVRRLNTQFEVEFGETVTLAIPAANRQEGIRRASADDEAADETEIVTIICITPERVRPMHAHPVPEPQPAPAQLPTY